MPKYLNGCCENCKKEYVYPSSARGRFCCVQCQMDFQNLILLENWKSGKDLGFSGKTKQLKKYIKRYLHEKAGYKCSKCGWDSIHPVTKKCPLEVNHIDGDAENCKEENLEVICPNCHSLTPNFRKLNSNSKRIRK